jgi:hypothetical protein
MWLLATSGVVDYHTEIGLVVKDLYPELFLTSAAQE